MPGAFHQDPLNDFVEEASASPPSPWSLEAELCWATSLLFTAALDAHLWISEALPSSPFSSIHSVFTHHNSSSRGHTEAASSPPSSPESFESGFLRWDLLLI